ncbi:MAG: hypothetical protein LBV61_08415 [Burkholderiaceae bacterium]|nr:hypothetical protein [Burkholderiaceae bacterium]
MKAVLVLPLCAAVAAALLAGCVEPTRVAVGASRAQALAQAGTPIARYPLPGGGERLQYSREPAGFEVTNIDIDATGKVSAVRPMLVESDFQHTIQIGAWRAPEVLRAYGKPQRVTRVSSFDGAIWQWRYRQAGSRAPRFLLIYFDPQGIVRRWQTIDDNAFGDFARGRG